LSSPSYSTTISSTAFYQCAVTCGGNTLYSNAVKVTVPATALPGGIYTINSAVATGGTNFQSFTDAFNAIKCGIAGAVTFNVAAGSGPYNEQVTLPHNNTFTATNTITINGNGATLTYNSTNSNERCGIKLDGADYVTINNLKVVATGTYGYCILLMNDADNVTINGCTIETNTTSTVNDFAGILASGSATGIALDSKCDNLTITNNTITGGAAGIAVVGGTTTKVTGTKILNNIIKDAYSWSVDVEYAQGAVIEGNDMSRPARTVIGTFYGTVLGNSLGCRISKNRMHNNSDAALTATASAFPILLLASDGTVAEPNIISNNLIYNMNGNGPVYALYNDGSDYAQFYYNTISIDNAASTAGDVRGFYQVTSALGIDVKNNIFSITRGGSGAKHILYRGTAASTITFDNNAYFLNAPAGTNNFGFATTAQATFAAWKTATSQDANSVEGTNPNFSSPGTGDFTPTNLTIDNKGTPITSVTTDFIGLTRNATTPDVGAYEFPCTTPAGLNATAITATTANLSWTPISASIGYEYAVTTSATPPASGTATTGTTYNAGTYSPGTVYYLHVRNKCGATTFSSWATLSFTTLCPAPATPNITGVNYTGANISWTAVTGASGYEFAITTSATPPTSGTAITTTTHSPTSLSSATTYYFHLRTQCSTGIFSSWTTASFTTPTCSAPASPNITAVTYNSANINWGTIASAIGYEYAITTSATPPASGLSTTATSVNPNSLLGATTYYVHLRTECAAGVFSSWTTANFTTLTPPCDPTATITVNGITTTAANINWAPVTGAIGYEYAVVTSPTPPASGTATTGTTFNPTTLTPGTTYFVHVRTQCGASLFSIWKTTSFTTAFPPCPDIANITVSAVNYTGATINWASVPSAIDYEYAITASPVPPAGGTVTTATSVIPTTLTPGTPYYVHVRSRCAGSMYSAWISAQFTTLTCATPPAVSANNITYTSADISWNPVGGSQGYEYAVNTTSTPPSSGLAITPNSINVNNLTPNTTYYIHVRNKCAASVYSAWSTISFNTRACLDITPTVENTGFTSALITWPSTGADAYEYLVSNVATPPATGFTTIDTSYSAINLTPGATYYVHLRVRCAPGIFSPWRTVSFVAQGCGKPDGVSVSNITTTGATVNWNTAANAQSYEYAITINGGSPTNVQATTNTSVSTNALIVNTTYNIHIRTVCGNNYRSDWTVAAFRTTNFPNSVSTVDNNTGIEAYPNPAHNTVTVRVNGASANGKIQLTDLTGRILKTTDVKTAETILDISHLSPGMYMIKYMDEAGSRTVKITRQ
jgi:hypothetical protein